MAEWGARLLLSISCITVLSSATVARHADKASGPRQFTPFWFSVEPVDTLAVRSSPVFLNCSAHSEPPARVEWKKDGTFLNLASDDRRQLLPDGSLLIPSVVHSKHSKPDEGFYQCVATIDSLGTIISRAARLTVAGFQSQLASYSLKPPQTEAQVA
ncbi:neogenin-like [Huso huso]|uniref:Neogenin-like n=1 Tax=Huso huso TaxID=61971 RepID=A0ABR0YS38_HUSHU